MKANTAANNVKMEQLEELLCKLKRNKEHVALDVLKTKYKVSYEQLLKEIKERAIDILQPAVLEFPKEISQQEIREHVMELASLFNQIYDSGGYSKKIGTALFQHYSADEAVQIAAEINQRYRKEVMKLLKSK